MAKQNSKTEKLLSELFEGILNGKKISEILNANEFPVELFEKFSLETTLKYWNRKMSYDEGDRIMNILFGIWTSNEFYFNNQRLSDVFLECYDAFDSGEYYHKDDDRNCDLSEKYTRPLVENLLRKRKLIE